VKYLSKGLNIKMTQAHPEDEIKTILPELKDHMMDHVKASSDEFQAVSIALDSEKAASEFYKAPVDEAIDEKERSRLSKLCEEQREHHAILLNTHSFIKDTGDWLSGKSTV